MEEITSSSAYIHKLSEWQYLISLFHSLYTFTLTYVVKTIQAHTQMKTK